MNVMLPQASRDEIRCHSHGPSQRRTTPAQHERRGFDARLDDGRPASIFERERRYLAWLEHTLRTPSAFEATKRELARTTAEFARTHKSRLASRAVLGWAHLVKT